MKRAFATAALALSLFASASPLAFARAKIDPKPVVEVAFVLDTTGSMAGLIEGAKKKIWSIATSIADDNPDAELRMAIVAYRDIGDDYVTRTFELTDDIQDLYGKLLAFQADGGNDWPESVNEALDVAVTKLDWGQGRRDSRIIFLVGDAPPHMDYPQDRKYREVIKDARSRGIIVNAVQAGPAEDTERVWRSIAQLGKGQYIPIPQDGGQVMVIISPFDDEIRRVQIEIDETVIPYGGGEQQEAVRSKLDTRKAAPAPSAADNSSYVLKKSKGKDVITGSGDLVSDLEQGRIALDAIKEKDLPEGFADLGRAEQISRLKDYAGKRAALSEKMAALVKQRDAYVAKQSAAEASAGAGDSFDRKVAETLREQIMN
jgi:von Willebrand factor type A domain